MGSKNTHHIAVSYTCGDPYLGPARINLARLIISITNNTIRSYCLCGLTVVDTDELPVGARALESLEAGEMVL